MSLLQSVREWLDEVFGEDTATDEVDEEYLEQLRFAYIETAPDGHRDMIRCDLCARLFDTMDDCVEHVAQHDEQGSASVDPFKAARTADSEGHYQTDEPFTWDNRDLSDGSGNDSQEVPGR